MKYSSLLHIIGVDHRTWEFHWGGREEDEERVEVDWASTGRIKVRNSFQLGGPRPS